MKKTLYQIGMLAAAAIAFVGCQKEVDINNQEEFTHVATIILNKADDTKTAVDETGQKASYYWTAGDDQYLHVYENGTAGTITNFDISDPTVAILTVSFTGTPTAPYSYEARYYSEASNSGNPKVPAEQSPKSDNFDPAADIMISKVITSNDRLTSLEFIMGRVVTVNKMTLTGLTAGEKVSKVEFTLDKQISAVYQLSSNTFTSNSTKLTLNYSNAEVPTGGSFPVYFVAAPVENAAIKSVVVTTDTNVYTKSDQLDPNPFANKSITFAVGTMKRFNMAMAGYGTAIPNAVKYYEVTSADEIADGGIYLITSTKTNGDAYAFGDYNSSFYSAEAVTISNDPSLGNYIEISAEQVLPVTLEDAGNSQFYILDADGEYLSYSGSSNDVSRGDTADGTAYKWTVAVHEIASVNVNGRKLQFNNNSPRFACYSTSQRPITLYYQEGSIVVTQKLPAPTNVDAIVVDDDILVTWEDITAPSGETVTYHVTCTGEAAQDIAEDVESATFENLADGTYEISVTAVPSTSAFNQSATVTVGNLVIDTTPAAPSYIKVTSALSDWSGQYLIVYEDNNVAFDGSLSDLDSTPNTFDVTINNSKIQSSSAVDAKSFTIATMEGGYSIQASTGKYIGKSANSNGMDKSDNALLNTISWSSNHPVITSVGGKTLGFNSASNQLKFRYLGNSDIQLYRLEDTRQDPGMSWSPTSASATMTDQGNTFTAPTLNRGNATSITYNSTNTAVATISNESGHEGEITLVGGGITTIQAIFTGDTNYKPQTVAYTLTVTDNRTPAATTIADVLAGGAGTYSISNLLVYSVQGNQVIVGDSSGKMVLYKSGHGLSVGDNVSIASATVDVHSGVLQIQDGTISTNSSNNAIDHGAAINLNDASVASSTLTAFQASGYHSAAYVTLNGSQSGRDIIGTNAHLYLSLANTTYDGQNVIVTGYIYFYNSTYSTLSFQLVSIEEDTTTPSLSVDNTSLSWAATEYGASNAKTITITLNGAASAGNYNISGANSDWTVNKNGNTITVYPNAANTSTTDDKSITLTIAHTGDSNVYKEVTCTQAKTGNNTPSPETITFANLGLTNGEQYSDPFDGGNFTITFAGGGNDGKYYDTGSGIRTYGDGTITIASSYSISEIAFTWDGSNAPSSDNASPSGYNTSTKKWTGDAKTVTLTRPSGSGHWRLKSVTVTYK